MDAVGPLGGLTEAVGAIPVLMNPPFSGIDKISFEARCPAIISFLNSPGHWAVLV